MSEPSIDIKRDIVSATFRMYFAASSSPPSAGALIRPLHLFRAIQGSMLRVRGRRTLPKWQPLLLLPFILKTCVNLLFAFFVALSHFLFEIVLCYALPWSLGHTLLTDA